MRLFDRHPQGVDAGKLSLARVFVDIGRRNTVWLNRDPGEQIATARR
jgi:hypothetical protein